MCALVGVHVNADDHRGQMKVCDPPGAGVIIEGSDLPEVGAGN